MLLHKLLFLPVTIGDYSVIRCNLKNLNKKILSTLYKIAVEIVQDFFLRRDSDEEGKI